MKNINLFIGLFFCLNAFSQAKICRTTIWNKEEVFQKNEIQKYAKYDCSVLWNNTENNYVYGVIGDNYQRISIKFISIKRNEKNKTEYLVYGKSSVNSNICDFTGTITIEKIQELKKAKFGLDREYENSGIKSQGLLTGSYKFIENKNQRNAGTFRGKLQTIFYVDKVGFITYNDIEKYSDGYYNNAFSGIWKSNNSGKEKICNWGDYRVPNVNCDLDIGAGEFSVSEKYLKNGWKSIQKQNWWK